MKVECNKVTVRDMIDKSKDCVNKLESLKAQTPDKYVIANDVYHYRGEGYAIKDTGLEVTCPTNAYKVKLFDTYKEAYDNIDFYLVNGRREPIELKAVSIKEYADKLIPVFKNFISQLEVAYPNL